MLLRQDLDKLERLNDTLADRAKPLCVLLRDVGAVLEDKPGDGAVTFCAEEVKKANAELKAIAADVKSTMQIGFAQSNQKLLECKSEIIATVGAKVDTVKSSGQNPASGKVRAIGPWRGIFGCFAAGWRWRERGRQATGRDPRSAR